MSRTHKNFLLSVSGRKAMVDSVLIARLTKVEAARKYNVTAQTVEILCIVDIGHETSLCQWINFIVPI